MKAKRHQATCQDTERAREWSLTINHLPGEVLLEIFDFYRQSIDPYDHQWRKKHAWLNLAHVSRKWQSVVFGSSSRLDLNVTVGPIKPKHLKKILSGPLPLFIDYKDMHGEITESVLWRLRATLRHHDRVREIAFEGSRTNYDMLFRATKCTFLVLESLVLCIGRNKVLPTDLKLPDAFLGPDLTDPHLRRLRLENVSLASIFGFLLSATGLTDLFLRIDTTAFGPSQETSLFACLRGMSCLRSLELAIPLFKLYPLPQPSTPNDIVPLLKLTHFRYDGQITFLRALAGISAPSLQEIDIQFIDPIQPPVHLPLDLPQFFNEMEEHYYAVHVTFQKSASHLSLLTQSEYISLCKPRFNLGFLRHYCMESMLRMSGALSARLSAVEELSITFKCNKTEMNVLEQSFPWRSFFQQFPCVKVLHIEGTIDTRIARILLQGQDPAFLPALEELELGKSSNQLLGRRRQTRPREAKLLAQERRAKVRMTAIRPFISARQRVGRSVKVSIIT